MLGVSANVVNGAKTFKIPLFSKLWTCIPAASPWRSRRAGMKAASLCEAMQQKPVKETTITQAYQFAETSNTEPGFGTPSRLTDRQAGGRWLVPQEFLDPLRQHAVPLEAGLDKNDRRAFVDL